MYIERQKFPANSEWLYSKPATHGSCFIQCKIHLIEKHKSKNIVNLLNSRNNRIYKCIKNSIPVEKKKTSWSQASEKKNMNWTWNIFCCFPGNWQNPKVHDVELKQIAFACYDLLHSGAGIHSGAIPPAYPKNSIWINKIQVATNEIGNYFGQ